MEEEPPPPAPDSLTSIHAELAFLRHENEGMRQLFAQKDAEMASLRKDMAALKCDVCELVRRHTSTELARQACDIARLSATLGTLSTAVTAAAPPD